VRMNCIMRKKIDRKAFILLLLYAKGPNGENSEPIRGRTRLTKLLFLLKEEKWSYHELGRLAVDYYEFEPDNYGPFDREVFNDVDFLRSLGFLTIKNIQVLPDEDAKEYLAALSAWSLDNDLVDEIYALEEKYYETEITITDLGINFVEQRILPRITNEQQLEAFEFVKKNYGGWKLDKLLRYIYSTYPQMASRSKIRQRLLMSS